MSSGNERLICCVTLIYSLVVCVTTQRATYQHNGRLCTYCQPGTHWAAHCTADKQTTCMTCPENTFTDRINKARTCRRCSLSCTKYVHQVITGNCTIRSDTRCECKSGYYLRNKHDPHCSRHSYCPEGHGVVISHTGALLKGTPRSNTRCEVCREGFFSKVSSRTEPCKPFTKCEYGIDNNGNSTHDNLCFAIMPSVAVPFTTTTAMKANNPPSTEPGLNKTEGKWYNTTGKTKQGLGTGGIVGIVIGTLVIMVIIGVVVCLYRKNYCIDETRQKKIAIHPANSVPLIPSKETVVKQPGGNNNTVTYAGHSLEDKDTVRLRMSSSTSSSSASSLAVNEGGSCSSDGLVNYQDPWNGQKHKVQLEDQKFTCNDDIYWLVAHELDLQNTPWKEVIMKLPGKVRMENCHIQRIEANYQQEGVVDIIYQSFCAWEQGNPGGDITKIAHCVIRAMQKSNESANRKLIEKIKRGI